MNQCHNLILWTKPSKEAFPATCGKVYKILNLLKNMLPECSPNFVAAKRKKDITPFDFKIETVENLLIKGSRKSGSTMTEDLGYAVDFFSSFENKESASIKFNVGISNLNFNNTLIINLPFSINLYNNAPICDKLNAFFIESIYIFKPFWGCISNDTNMKRFDTYFNGEKPTTIHWINFWNEEILKLFEEKNYNELLYSFEKLNGNGRLIRLKKYPIDDNSNADISLQNDINIKFGLR